MAIAVDFELVVDVKGYRLERGLIIGQGGAQRRMHLKDFRTLYLEFAKVQTPEQLLGFVNRFGRLTSNKLKKGQDGWEVERLGDDVNFVRGHAKTISMTLEMLRGHVGDLPKWRGGQFECEVPSFGKGAKMVGGIPIPARLGASLAPDPMTGTWQLKLQPPSLLDAIWLQLGQAIAGSADLKQCSHCGEWFEAGANSGKRRDAKFCSAKCKTRYFSLERSR